MRHIFRIKDLDCANCANKIQVALNKENDIQEADLNFMLKRLTVVSNEENQEVSYDGKLLEKIGVTEQDIKLQMSFDIIIEIEDGIKYKGTIVIDMPGENLIQEGKSTIEINNFENVVFKRI